MDKFGEVRGLDGVLVVRGVRAPAAGLPWSQIGFDGERRGSFPGANLLLLLMLGT